MLINSIKGDKSKQNDPALVSKGESTPLSDDSYSKWARFIDDVPLTEPEQSQMEIHERIAKEIAREVLAEEPENIAIVGEWGSGKSTVLEFLKKELQDSDPSPIFFIFDAWAHAGDALRKNFLMSLGDLIFSYSDSNDNANTSAKASWQEKSSRLVGTESIKTVIEQPKYSLFTSGLLACAALYIACQTILQIVQSINPCIPRWLTATISFGLPIVITIVLMVSLHFSRKKKLITETPSTDASKLDELFSLIIGHPDGSVEQTIKKSPDLDSLEFERIYSFLLENASERKIIIAIDNLDRLSSEKMKDVWDSIQIFAEYDSSEPNHSKKTWILLPIARRAFQDLTSRGDDSINLGVGTVSKLFLRQFEIPAPITTDWKLTFCKYLNYAFPEIAEVDVAAVFSIANSSNRDVASHTPREAKRFINEMVALSRMHRDVSYIALALYCSYNLFPEKDRKDILQILLSPVDSITEPNERKIRDSLGNQINSWVDNSSALLDELAMLNFGVFSAERAQEIFISRELHNDAYTGNGFDLATLINGRAGSWNILRDELAAMLSSEETMPEWYSYFSRVFFEFWPNSTTEEHELGEIRRLLVSYLPRAGWPLYSGFAQHAAKIIVDTKMSMATCGEIARHLNKELKKWVSESSDKELDSEEDLLIAETAIVFDALEEGGSLPDKIETDGISSNYWQFIICLADNNIEAEWLTRTNDMSTEALMSIVQGIASMIEANDEIPNSLWELIRISPPITCETDLQEPSLKQDNSLVTVYEYIACWIMAKIQVIESSRVQELIEEFLMPNSTDANNFVFMGELEVIGQIAIIDHIYNQIDNSDYQEYPSGILSNLADIQTVALKYREIIPSSFEVLLESLREDNYVELTLALLGGMWKEDDYGKLDIENCMAYACALGQSDRKAFGGRLYKAGRVQDLLGTQYDSSICNVYLGVSKESNDAEFRAWVFSGLEQKKKQEWDKLLSGSNYTPVLLAIYCNQLPKLLEESVIDHIVNGNVEHIAAYGLLPFVSDKHAVNNAISQAFADDTSRKKIIEYLDVSETIVDWFKSLTADERLQLVQIIINNHTIYSCEWLYRLLISIPNAKSVFYGKIGKMRDLLTGVEKLKDSTMPKKAKSTCRSILGLLK